MEYFKEEKEILEKLRDDLKEYFELEKKLSNLGKTRPKEEKIYQKWIKEISCLSDQMDKPIFDLPKQIKKLDPPMYWFEKFMGREVGYWGGWKRKAKKKIKNLPREERKEAKEELERLMPLHWELKEYEGQLDGALDSVVVFWDKEKAVLRKEIEESKRKVARLNAEESRLNAEESSLKEEKDKIREQLRREGRLELLEKLEKEDEEIKACQKKQE